MTGTEIEPRPVRREIMCSKGLYPARLTFFGPEFIAVICAWPLLDLDACRTDFQVTRVEFSGNLRAGEVELAGGHLRLPNEVHTWTWLTWVESSLPDGDHDIDNPNHWNRMHHRLAGGTIPLI